MRIVKCVNVFLYLLIIILITIFLLCAIEGFLSFSNVLKSFRPLISERSHTRYDEKIGWVNLNNFSDKDYYGKGLSLNINDQGFRNKNHVALEKGPHSIRVMCSGDSFTLGYGVGDQDAWCNRLQRLNSKWEAINLGQGGYGIDQSYLLYVQQGIMFNPDVHIFAFIKSDLSRYASTFLGYSKPTINFIDGQLQVGNVPVSKASHTFPWVYQNLNRLNSLNIYKLISSLVKKKGQSSLEKSQDPLTLTVEIFRVLNQMNQQKGVKFVVLMLPVGDDYNSKDFDKTRILLKQRFDDIGIKYIDLFDSYRALDKKMHQKLFIKKSKFPSGSGHYSTVGNHWVAQEVYRYLHAQDLLNGVMSIK